MENRIKYSRFQFFVALSGILVGIFAAIISFIQYKEAEPQKRELTLQMLNAEELTKFSRVPELTAEFKYFGENIENLWRIDAVIYNSGTRTLIGRGPKRDLIEESLNFNFEGGGEILNANINKNQPYASVRKLNDNSFTIRFTQWRPAEELHLSFLIANSKGFGIPTINSKDKRGIAEGRIIIECPSAFGVKTPLPKSLLEYLPRPFVVVIKILDIVVCVGFAVLLSVFSVRAAVDFNILVKEKSWKKEYGEAFKLHLEAFEDTISKTDIHKYIKRPRQAPSFLFEKFDGPGRPRDTVAFESFKDILLVGGLSLFGAIVLITAVFNFIPL